MFGKPKMQMVQLNDLGDFMNKIMSQQQAGTTITIYINELHIHQAAGQQAAFPALEMGPRRAQLPAPAAYPFPARDQYNADHNPFDASPDQLCAYCGQGVWQGKHYQGGYYHRECLSLITGSSQIVDRY